MGGDGKALSRQQVRALDRRAVRHWGVPALVLMENAGRNAADAIARLHSRLLAKGAGPSSDGGVAVVAGVGNNGGDGFVIARHLHNRGMRVAIFVVGDSSRMSPDAATNYEILRRLNLDIRLRAGAALGRLSAELRHFDVIVDAIGGTGITGPLRGDLATAVEQVNAAGRPVVAVDIPTGLDCDTGKPLGPTVKAALTVTMAARKIGFDAPEAKAYTGKVVLVDIGVPMDLPETRENENLATETRRSQRTDK